LYKQATGVSDQKTISFYATISEKTDPEEYTYLYDYLPESPEKLCANIKVQLIHPLAATRTLSEDKLEISNGLIIYILIPERNDL